MSTSNAARRPSNSTVEPLRQYEQLTLLGSTETTGLAGKHILNELQSVENSQYSEISKENEDLFALYHTQSGGVAGASRQDVKMPRMKEPIVIPAWVGSVEGKGSASLPTFNLATYPVWTVSITEPKPLKMRPWPFMAFRMGNHSTMNNLRYEARSMSLPHNTWTAIPVSSALMATETSTQRYSSAGDTDGDGKCVLVGGVMGEQYGLHALQYRTTSESVELYISGNDEESSDCHYLVLPRGVYPLGPGKTLQAELVPAGAKIDEDSATESCSVSSLLAAIKQETADAARPWTIQVSQYGNRTLDVCDNGDCAAGKGQNVATVLVTNQFCSAINLSDVIDLNSKNDLANNNQSDAYKLVVPLFGVAVVLLLLGAAYYAWRRWVAVQLAEQEADEEVAAEATGNGPRSSVLSAPRR